MERAAGETMTEETMIPTSAAEAAEGGGGGDGGCDESLQFDTMVMMEILSRLPVKSLARFRCVCKCWCSHHRISASTNSLLFSCLGPLALYDFGGGEITRCPLPPPTDDPLLCRPMLSNAVDGLVCGFTYSDTIVLRNLSTGEVALLPSPTREAALANIGLGFDVSTGKYKLLRVFCPLGSPENCVCEALTVSANQEWRYLGKSPPLLPLREFFYFNGFIHWIDCGEQYAVKPVAVVAFDFKHEAFSTIPIPESAFSEPAEVVGFEGHLCFVDMHSSCLKLLMLEDYARPVWTTLYVINCAVLSRKIADRRLIGIKNGKVLLQDRSHLEHKLTIHSYDLCSKVWSQMICRPETLSLCLYTESLVSPRRLLSLHGE